MIDARTEEASMSWRGSWHDLMLDLVGIEGKLDLAGFARRILVAFAMLLGLALAGIAVFLASAALLGALHVAASAWVRVLILLSFELAAVGAWAGISLAASVRLLNYFWEA